MEIQRCYRKAVQTLVAIASAVLGIVVLQGSLHSAEPQAIQVLSRTNDPVIIKGNSVGAFLGKPTNQVFAYVWETNAWVQIPFQIDEVSAVGGYVAAEDGILDENDEIVLMAKDTGIRAPENESPADGLALAGAWYEIKITDPVSASEEAWVYLVHSAILTQTFSENYVDFLSLTHQIQGENYVIRYATPNPWVDRISLGGNPTNILDRNKTRICTGPLFCLKEEALPNVQDGVIKDGPVRAIIRNGRVQAYGTMLAWTNQFTLPLAGDVQFSLDFLPSATGSNFFNAAIPTGVVVDGEPDVVPETPFSPWIQMSTEFGTLIQVVDEDKLTGTPRNFYLDQSDLDLQDTGDRRRYGEAGIIIEDPGQVIEYNFSLYILTDKQPNRGAEFTEYYNEPLQVQAILVSPDDESAHKLFTPLIMK